MNLEDFRQEKDHFFRHGHDSPLTDDQKNSFTGLKYFPANPSLKLVLPLDRQISGEEILPIQTSQGDTEPYRRYGRINFKVGGQPAVLTVFANPDNHTLFLPFRDQTSGKESYGSGRYVEVEEDGDKLKVDFNYAYNPYCAYNEHWRCPLTPAENILTVPIEAGEKKFHD